MAAEQTCVIDVLDKSVSFLVGRWTWKTYISLEQDLVMMVLERYIIEKMNDEERSTIEDYDLASGQILKE